MTLSRTSTTTGARCPTARRRARLLVTNLANRVQPIIRLESGRRDDARAASRARAGGRCGASSASRDAPRTCSALPAPTGGAVTVLPAQFSVVTRDREVRRVPGRQEGERLGILVVPRRGAAASSRRACARGVAARLSELGVDDAADRRRAPRRAGALARRQAADRGGRARLVPRRGDRLAGEVGPLLEVHAQAVGVEHHHPEVAVLARPGVLDLDADDGRVALLGHDRGGEREGLVGARALALPHRARWRRAR